MPKPSGSTGPITIKGGRGADRIVIGEPGYEYSATQQARGFIIEGGNGDDFLAGGSGVDQVRGGAGFDEIVGQEEDLLGAPAGKAAYDGGLDRDVVNFSAWTEGVGIDLGTTNTAGDLDRYYTDFSMATPTSLYSTGTYTAELRGVTTSIEGIIGGSANDSLGGDWGHNYIDGGAGDDYISGKYGNDRLIGGAGNDLIFTGTDDDIVTGDDPGNAAVEGNDIFAIGGGVVGDYFVTTITDYDTRADEFDTQFDRIWFNEQMEWTFGTDANGNLTIIYGTDFAGLLGEVVLVGLTMADIDSLVIQYWDPDTGMGI